MLSTGRGGSNSLGPVAPRPTSWFVPPSGQKLRCASLKPAFTCLSGTTSRNPITDKQKIYQKMNHRQSQNKHDKSVHLFACFVKDLNQKALMFYNNKWYIDHQDWKWVAEIKRYETLFPKRKRTHSLINQSSLFLFICSHRIHHIQKEWSIPYFFPSKIWPE